MDIERICNVLESGGLVITPTDTVYGVMGDALNEDVIKKVFEVKKRPYSKPLILLMDSIEMVCKYVSDISDIEEYVMNNFWPGLVTIILKKNDKVSNLITGGQNTVAIRIPDNHDLLEVIRRLGRPVISSSANITGSEVITSVSMIEDELRDKIDYIEDGGEIVSLSSTIIEFIDNELVVLRDGVLADKIKSTINQLKI